MRLKGHPSPQLLLREKTHGEGGKGHIVKTLGGARYRPRPEDGLEMDVRVERDMRYMEKDMKVTPMARRSRQSTCLTSRPQSGMASYRYQAPGSQGHSRKGCGISQYPLNKHGKEYD